MKKIFFTTAFLLTIGLSAIFAQSNKKTGDWLQVSFNENFANAKDVSWKKLKNFTEATFSIGDQQLSVFYNEDNRPYAVSRNITSSQLPLALLGDIKRNYADYWISNLFELLINDHSDYYITLEKADRKIVLKSENGGQWVKINTPEGTAL